ncbi:MAG: Rieske (2Fe-2S) protein [Gammaproteobacteria bacterium]|nr:Rieske (2Fe-2S) protein [Gammaproteobacteria bacterium]
MAFKPAMELAQLQQESRHVTVIDGHKILFIWYNDKVHAIQSQCPHLKLPLVKGKITEECAIVCPFHKSEFDLNTGEAFNLLGKLSKEKNLTVYPTQVQNGQIMVEIG